MSDIQLVVGETIYSGWKAMRVQRSIEQMSGAFALEVSERWPGQALSWPIEPGSACSVLLDSETVITGYVDSVERSMDARQHQILVSGRDKAADLVDCQALLPNGRTDDLRGQTLLQIAQIIAGHYGIRVEANVSLPRPFRRFSIGPTETAWECIARAAAQRAVLAISDGKGGLLITRAGAETEPCSLVEGKNVLAAKLVRDDSRRYRWYIAIAQDVTDGSLDYYGEQAAQPSARIEDPAIRSPRTLMFYAEDLADGISLKDRVLWERNTARGRGRYIEVRVQGWSTDRNLWQPNRMVQVHLPTLGIDGKLLVVAVDHALDATGSTTTLKLAPREAYDLLPQAEDDGADSVPGVSKETLELLK